MRFARTLDAIVAPLLSVAAGVATNVLAEPVPPLRDGWRYVAAVIVAFLVYESVSRWRSRRADPATGSAVSPERAAAAAEDLAALVRVHVDEELQNRHLEALTPLAVTWTLPGSAVSPPRQWLTPDLHEIRASIDALPRRQVFILGAAGSGKTMLAMLLVSRLLADREAGAPVPVLLSLAEWIPTAEPEHLDNWISGRIAARYPGVCDLATARHLVVTRRILPVLDGLDEVPERWRPALARLLRRVLGAGRPVLVTCREREHRTLSELPGAPLAGAAALHVEPVERAEIEAFLDRHATRVRKLAGDAGRAALAGALDTPLMMFLAQVRLTEPETDADAGRTPRDRDAVIAWLLDGFVPAMYAARPDHYALRDLPGRAVTYPPGRAGTWLRYLAGHLEQRGAHAFGWWEFDRAAGRVVAAVVGAGLAILTFSLVNSAFGPIEAIVTGLLVGLLAGGLMVFTDRPDRLGHDREPYTPVRSLIRDRRRTMLVALIGGTCFGAVLGAAFADALNLASRVGLRYAISFGVAFGLGAVLDRSWGKFVVARAWLGLRGHLPFRLGRFLADAHRRGVLRRIDARYQFCHDRIQRHLGTAGRERPVPVEPVPAVWWAPLRVRLGVALPLVFIFGLTLPARALPHPPPFRSGDPPEEVMDVVCVGDGACQQYLSAYRWRLDAGADRSSTFDAHLPSGLVHFARTTGELSVERARGCRAVIGWHVLADGRRLGGGEVHAARAAVTDLPMPPHADTVTITLARLDHDPCAAEVRWDRSGFSYDGN